LNQPRQSFNHVIYKNTQIMLTLGDYFVIYELTHMKTSETRFIFDGRKLRPFLTKPVREHARDWGISYGYLRLILCGQKRPSGELQTTICMTLGVPLDRVSIPVTATC